MLVFDDLTPETWWQYEQHILHSETFFTKSIRTDKDEYIDIFNFNNIAKVVKLNSIYIGNIIGCTLMGEEVEECGLTGMDLSKTLYLINFIIDPPHQRKGYGRALLLEFIRSAAERGYERIIGHFKPGTSLPMIKKFGGREIGIARNWCETGEDYVLCELDIKCMLPVARI